MLNIGLTGGIGCGKSTVTEAFAAKGISIIDADKIARDIIAPKTEALADIISIFGNALLQQDGSLNRSALKQQVFADTEKLQQLEDILHPKIRQAIKNKLMKAASTLPLSPYIVADIPLLIEKDYIDLFDRIVVVDCLPEQQIQRVKQRDKMSTTIIQSIMDKQVSRQQRLKQATHILDNQESKKALLIQVNSLHASFLQCSLKQ
jgi:dephospho-CoA kinase